MHRNMSTIVTGAAFITLSVLAANWLVDLVYASLDPRTKTHA